MNESLQNQRRLRKSHIFIATAGGGAAIVIVWGWVLIKWLFNVDLFAKVNRDIEVGWTFTLALAAVVTLAAIIWGFYYVWRVQLLAKRGVEVVATIKGVSRVAAHGQTPIRYQYEFRGVRYSGAADVTLERAEQIEAAGEVVVLVDPHNPKRSALREDIFFQE